MGQILSTNTIDSATPVYGMVKMPDSDKGSFQLETTDLGSFAGTIELWSTDVVGALRDSDVDWVKMTDLHGFEGFVGVTTVSGVGTLTGSQSATVVLSNMNSEKYKIKVMRSAGSATVACHFTAKRSR